MKFLSLLKTLLWWLLVFLVFALIWWGGPELRLGESRPLEPVGWRLGLIGLILLLFLAPLISRFIAFLSAKLATESAEPQEDPVLQACRGLLRELRRQPRSMAGWTAPDFLIVGGAAAQSVLAHWPAPIRWQLTREQAGHLFCSQGRIYLVPEEGAWATWSRLLRWRRPVRGALLPVSQEVWADAGRRAEALKSFQDLARQWLRGTRRILPVWTLILGSDTFARELAADAQLRHTPWGLTFPAGQQIKTALRTCAQQWLGGVERLLANPFDAPERVQQWMRLRWQCGHLLEVAEHELVGLSRLDGQTVTGLRGLFFAWPSEEGCSGLPGLLTVLHKDQGRAPWQWRARLQVGLVLAIAAVCLLVLVLNATWLRTMRHGDAQRLFLARISATPAVQMLGATVKPGEAHLSEWVLALNELDGIAIDTEDVLGESLAHAPRDLLNEVHGRALRQGLLQGLQASNRQLHGRKNVSASQQYRHLAFAMMLGQPDHADLALMRQVLSGFELSPPQVNAVLDHWSREKTSFDVAEQWPETKDWRVLLQQEEGFTLENRLWSGVRELPLPAEAEDFSLARHMGPTGAWFDAPGMVPWIFTHGGLQQGYHPASKNYKHWAEEYLWVMASPHTVFTKNDEEEMALRMRTLYVNEASRSWKTWFKDIRLEPASDLTDAVERVQLFASEASPLHKLLNLLEQHMPVPKMGQQSLWGRFQQRLASDWARVQYELGWRRSPKVNVSATDPVVALGQEFALLQGYFSDGSKESGPRMRLLTSYKTLAGYLERVNSAAQLDMKPPATKVIDGLRVQALRLPSPLREITLSFMKTANRQAKAGQAQALQESFQGVPSLASCRRAAGGRFPFDLQAQSEVSWDDFSADFGAQGELTQLWKNMSKDPVFQSLLADADKSGLGLGPQEARGLQRAAELGKTWFPKPGQLMRLNMRPVALSPGLRVVRLRVGDLEWSYAHGQVRDQTLEWSSERGVPRVEMEMVGVGGESHHISYVGPWSLLRWAGRAKQIDMSDKSSLVLQFNVPQGYVQLLLSAESARNPLDLGLYQGLCEMFARKG